MTPKPPEISTPLADRLAREPTVSLEQWRRVRLAERALAGDLESAIQWLAQHETARHRKRAARSHR
jgi:hypothetical protein